MKKYILFLLVAGFPATKFPIILDENARKLIVGSQMCSWEMSEYMEYPGLSRRLAAFSEVCWNTETRADFPNFEERMRLGSARLDRMIYPFTIEGVGFIARDYNGLCNNYENRFADSLTISIESTLIGKATPTSDFFHRIDTSKYNDMPGTVKKLLTNSAGLAVAFKTDGNIISAKWSTARSQPGGNMTDIMARGLDLYIKRDGAWEFAAVGKPASGKNSTTAVLIDNMEEGEKECLLYLPLYDETTSLEIGTSAGRYIEPIPNPFRGKVIIYGSSITQGASATRPGMAYPSRMARSLGVDFINLGLSGSGKMERAVADMITDIEADAYILDCAANPSPEQISERTEYFVSAIRERHPDAPIIMIESVVRESGNFDTKIEDRVREQNRTFKNEYLALKSSGVTDLFYIEGALLGTDHEGTVDGVHPNDLGFDRMLRIIEPKIQKVLKKYGIIR
jgi:hypothetical protein